MAKSILISNVLPAEAASDHPRRSRGRLQRHEQPTVQGGADQAAAGQGRLDLPHHLDRRRGGAQRRARAEGRRERGGGLQQHRRGRRPAPWRRRHQHAGRPHRDHRRLRLGAADGGRPPCGRGRSLRRAPASGRPGSGTCCGATDIHGKTLGVVGFGRIGRAWRGGRSGLRHARPLSRHRPGRRGRRARAEGDRRRPGHAPARVRLRDPAHAAHSGDAAPHQRAHAPAHEEDRRPGQRRAGSGGGRGGARPRAHRGLDRRGGAGRLRGRAQDPPRPAAAAPT